MIRCESRRTRPMLQAPDTTSFERRRIGHVRRPRPATVAYRRGRHRAGGGRHEGVRVLLLVLVTAVAAVALVGCGGDDDEGATETTTETTETDTTATGSRLIGTVGSESDPDAYVITLTTEDGSAVTTLAAGTTRSRSTTCPRSTTFI